MHLDQVKYTKHHPRGRERKGMIRHRIVRASALTLERRTKLSLQYTAHVPQNSTLFGTLDTKLSKIAHRVCKKSCKWSKNRPIRCTVKESNLQKCTDRHF